MSSQPILLADDLMADLAVYLEKLACAAQSVPTQICLRGGALYHGATQNEIFPPASAAMGRRDAAMRQLSLHPSASEVNSYPRLLDAVELTVREGLR